MVRTAHIKAALCSRHGQLRTAPESRVLCRMGRKMLFLLFCLLFLASCGNSGVSRPDANAIQPETSENAPNASAVSENAHTGTVGETDENLAEKEKFVVDCDGNTVAIPAIVDRVAALYAYNGHLTVMLGAEDKLVAVIEGLKRDMLIRRKIPDIVDYPVPFTVDTINIESLMMTRPDVVFLRRDTGGNQGETEKLMKAGIPYAVVDYSSIEEQKYSIQLAGEILNQQQNAQDYLDYYTSTIAMIEERVAEIPEEKRLRVYQSVNEVVRTNHPGEISYEILDIVGAVNVAKAFTGELSGDKAFVNVETIYLWDPDCIVAIEPSAVNYLRTNENFASLRCVREGRVYQLPVGATRWTHPGSLETPIGALALAKLLYPDSFADVDMQKETRDFYQNFWRIDLTDEEIGEILSGSGMRLPKDRAVGGESGLS